MSKDSGKSFLEQASSVLNELKDAAEGLQKLGADQWIDSLLTNAGIKAKDEKPDLKVVPDEPQGGVWEKCINYHDRCTKHTAHRGGMGRPRAGGEGFLIPGDDAEQARRYQPSQPLYEGGNSGPGFEVRHPSAYYQRGTRDLQRNSIYPYKEGDNIVIGPECFISSDERVITYAGQNYYRGERQL